MKNLLKHITICSVGLIIAHFSTTALSADSPSPSPTTSAEQESARIQKLNDDFNKNEQAVIDAQKTAQAESLEAQKKHSNCERAKAHLQEMESHERIRLTNAKGETKQLTTEERASEIEATQKAIKDFCP